MIYAELIHNPYLLQTIVSFNGQSPRINSQIEKYENQTLKDWVHKVPQIFYDEMNGYDFDLNFTGTRPDYEEVQNAFANAGISPDDVRLFLKNELEDADTKSLEIDDLLSWLKDHPNRKFRWDTFYNNHTDLFDSTYPYIVIRGNKPEEISSQISIEHVGGIGELDGTLLRNTPLLFIIDESSVKEFRSDLTMLLTRKDIDQRQLFFMLHPTLDEDHVERVIRDLGVDNPQIVSTFNDPVIMAFLRNYPITEYIRETIRVFEEEVGRLSEILDSENKESAILNAEIHVEIDQLEDNLSRLKAADESFVERDNFQRPNEFAELHATLETQIRKWRNRKTKVTGDQEAEIAAKDYDVEIRKYLDTFDESIRNKYKATCVDIAQKFRKQYATQGLDTDYFPKDIIAAALSKCHIPSLVEDFLGLKEITFEEPKADLFNLFLSSSKEAKEPVRVVTCYYDHWRNKAVERIMPIADMYIQEASDSLQKYYDTLADAFHSHLIELILAQSQKKETVSAQLSDEERKLQEDNDWLVSFKEQLARIERG